MSSGTHLIAIAVEMIKMYMSDMNFRTTYNIAASLWGQWIVILSLDGLFSVTVNPKNYFTFILKGYLTDIETIRNEYE